MPSYGQYCPVARAAEILNERWTLLILRDILGGARRFNEIRKGVPRMSPTLLSKRLKSLEACELIVRRRAPKTGVVGMHFIVNPIARLNSIDNTTTAGKRVVDPARYIPVDKRDVRAFRQRLQQGTFWISDPDGQLVRFMNMSAPVKRDMRFTIHVHVGGGQGFLIVDCMRKSAPNLLIEFNHVDLLVRRHKPDTRHLPGSSCPPRPRPCS